MSVKATYSLCVDLNGDGDYLDASEDISAYWRSIRVQRGVTKPGEHLARSATMSVTLNNSSGKFSPENASALSGFLPGKRIRLQMTYSGTTKQLYEGYITPPIRVVPGANGQRVTMVQCDGYFSALQNEPVRVSPLQNVYSGAVAAEIFKRVRILPAIGRGFRPGVAGFSEPNSTAIPAAFPLTAETGAQFYAYVGDTWTDGTSVYAALKELVEAEQGFCFEARDSGVYFWSRSHFPQDLANAVDATWDGTYNLRGAGSYTYGDNLINSLDVTVQPRSLETTQSVVAVGDAVIVNRGQSKTVTLQYRDDQGNAIGALNVVTPQPFTDFRATFNGKEYTAQVQVTAVALGDRVEVTFTNNTNPWTRVGIPKGWRVRGNKYIAYGRQQVHVQNDSSISAYMPHPAPALNLSLVQDLETAEALANYIVNRNCVPRGTLPGVSFYANRDATFMAQARDRTIGDRIAFSETQTGVNAEYWIVGETHDIGLGDVHKVSYVFEPRDATGHWIAGIAGYTEPNSTAIPG